MNEDEAISLFGYWVLVVGYRVSGIGYRVSDASLLDASLSDASLLDASLSDASLSDASLLDASLLDASLLDASLLAIGYRLLALSPYRLIAFLCYPIAALPRPIGGLPPSYSLQEASYRALPVP